MEERLLGNSGLRVSTLGLGCNNFGWQIDVPASKAVLHKALDLGVTHLDTADIYGDGTPENNSEAYLGQLLGPRRKDVVIGTKFGLKTMNPADGLAGASRRYIMQAVEASLKRLNTDWIDLYYLHIPDGITPTEETLRALDELIHQGKIRYAACSNMSPWKVTEAHWIAKYHHLNGYIASQNQYSLVARDVEKELAPALEAAGMGLVPFFPLASGFLTGKYKRGEASGKDTRFGRLQGLGNAYATDANWEIVEKLSAFAASRDKELLDLAFAWLLAKRGVASVIAGATRPEQIERNAQAVTWKLTPDEVAEVDDLSSKG
ncbi:aldo/keto reductase [Emcibacter sp. SYSU 3D8]|uniref:aldo/keto reductase n=1 Tax=Emcibacter sp. SYSU 3D8 TaxID=3133969 RepID=UPI0031FF35EF